MKHIFDTENIFNVNLHLTKYILKYIWGERKYISNLTVAYI